MDEEKESENEPATEEPRRSSIKPRETESISRHESNKKVSKTKKKRKKKNVNKKNADKELIQLPPCQHAYCLGEVLKKAGIEPGVCRPRPLPWALTGNLPYLPGWEKECRDYKLQQICYEVKPKKLSPDQERYKNELREAKILWSFLKPALLYPKNPVYDAPEPGIMCDCKTGTCKRDPPNDEE